MKDLALIKETMSSLEIAEHKLKRMFGNDFGEDLIQCFKTKKKRSYKTYIAIDSSTGYVKIGRSMNPESRIRALTTANVHIKLYAIVNDDYEKEIQKKLIGYKISGEWFKISNEILNEITEKYKLNIICHE